MYIRMYIQTCIHTYEHCILFITMQFTEMTGDGLKKACSEFASNQARAERLFKVSITLIVTIKLTHM